MLGIKYFFKNYLIFFKWILFNNENSFFCINKILSKLSGLIKNILVL